MKVKAVVNFRARFDKGLKFSYKQDSYTLPSKKDFYKNSVSDIKKDFRKQLKEGAARKYLLEKDTLIYCLAKSDILKDGSGAYESFYFVGFWNDFFEKKVRFSIEILSKSELLRKFPLKERNLP